MVKVIGCGISCKTGKMEAALFDLAELLHPDRALSKNNRARQPELSK
jgi:hypothetical protein